MENGKWEGSKAKKCEIKRMSSEQEWDDVGDQISSHSLSFHHPYSLPTMAPITSTLPSCVQCGVRTRYGVHDFSGDRAFCEGCWSRDFKWCDFDPIQPFVSPLVWNGDHWEEDQDALRTRENALRAMGINISFTTTLEEAKALDLPPLLRQ